jgi:predicted Zn finger-like uncharacterized protein
MLIACPNCGTSYGVEMATLRPPRGWTRQVRCHRCRCVWQAELSYADKLVVAANAVAPVRRAMAAVAQAAADTADYAADYAEARLQPLERATALLANELEVATIRSEQEPISRQHLHPMPTAIGACATAVAEFLGTIAARVARCYSRVRQKDWRLQDWRSQDWSLQEQSLQEQSLQDWSLQDRSPQISLLHVARLQVSRLQIARLQVSRLQLIIAGLILADAAIIGWRTDLVWAMPQTASFYAGLGLPVNVRGVQFETVTAAAERHDGEPILIVKGEIGNGTNNVQAVPHLRFAVRDLQRQEIYSWTAALARGSLAPGEALAFRSELALPPPNTSDVVVRFVDRDDSF